MGLARAPIGPTAARTTGGRGIPPDHEDAEDAERTMKELLRTTDVVTISFVEALLTEAGVGFFVADQEGSLGVLPCRILVDVDDHPRATALLRDAGLEAELSARG